MKEAIILAGGYGTRLQSVIKDIPKPMAPIKGRPFLTYLLDNLAAENFNHIILSTGYLHEKIESFFGNHYKEMKISYAHEKEPLGTGGAIQYALSFCKSPNVIVLNGDTLFKVNLSQFIQFHKNKNTLLSIVLRNVEDVSRYGSVSINNKNQIIDFSEKQKNLGEGYINGGIYILQKELFNRYPQPQKFSFEKDILEKLYTQELFYGWVSKDYFLDIGIPEDYARALIEL